VNRLRSAWFGAPALLLAVVVAAGCSSDSSDTGAPASEALTATGWVLNERTDLGVPSRGVAVTADFAAGHVSGNSGCNSYRGRYEVTGRKLTIGSDIASTKARCEPGPTAVEAVYLKRLSQVQSFAIEGDTLTLFGVGDEAMLVYTASAGRDAITGEWTAISYYTGTAVQAVIAGSPLTARFDRGQVTGDSGCNNFSGPYEVTDASISVGPFTSTLMACVDPARQTQEQQYLAALELAATFQVTGNRLELQRADGGIAATFEKSAASG
jgi:heat shock protein HslJ